MQMTINYLTIISSVIMILTFFGASSLVAKSEHTSILKIKVMEQENKYVGMWVTADGFIRQELLPNGRYDEARGTKKSAYTGRYEIKGDHISYRDDTGFTATGDFKGSDTLYHGGYVFYRQLPQAKQQ
jgi:hypothetical protein